MFLLLTDESKVYVDSGRMEKFSKTYRDMCLDTEGDDEMEVPFGFLELREFLSCVLYYSVGYDPEHNKAIFRFFGIGECYELNGRLKKAEAEVKYWKLSIRKLGF